MFLLYRKAHCQASEPLCETEKASAKDRHSFCHQATHRACRTRETVEARRQSCGLQTHRRPAPTEPHRSGRLDPYPRTDQATQRQKGYAQATPCQCHLLQMALCRLARLYCLQGALYASDGHTGTHNTYHHILTDSSTSTVSHP